MFSLSGGGQKMRIVKGMAGPEKAFICVFSELHLSSFLCTSFFLTHSFHTRYVSSCSRTV